MIKLNPVFNGILFEGTHDTRTGEIYSINPDGTGVVRLTNDNLTDADPDVSPTGPAFVWARFGADGTSEIYSQNLDGSSRKQLTSLGNAVSPRYSPNGAMVAFSARNPRPAQRSHDERRRHGRRATDDDGRECGCPVVVAGWIEDRVQAQRQ